MQNRLVITLALALLGAALTAGVVGAQSSQLGTGEAGVSIDLPDGGELPSLAGELPHCSNGEDDDEDGVIDLEDEQCKGPLDRSEEPVPPGGDGDEQQPGGDQQQPGDKKADEETGGGRPGNLPDNDNPFKDDREKGGKKGGDQKGSQNGGGNKKGEGSKGSEDKAPEIRKPDGRPTNSNPSVSVAPFGPAPIGVPNFVIDQFTIPPFLLPIYQACGTEYGIPWQVLASINRIETAFGTNLNVSTAGAVGWMQFLPSTWKAYGVDANRDGRKDPYNPVDAICGAARYLNASGGSEDLRRAIFAYNHADWYVDEVLLYARQYGKLPSGLVDSLTGLTEGAHFPVAARARYADDISERAAQRRSTPSRRASGNAADVISDSPTRRGINIFAKQGAPVVAVNDGVIKKVDRNKRLGRHIVLEDAYGNEFTYAKLGKVADAIPVPKDRKLSASDFKLVSPGGKGDGGQAPRPDRAGDEKESGAPVDTENSRERVFALPERKHNRERADLNGQLDELLDDKVAGYETVKARSGILKFDPKTMDARPLRKGSKVVAGTVLARVGAESDELASHVHFAIEPAGRGSRKIDPKPILDGWKLLEATAIYRAAGKDPFSNRASVGQILLMSKGQLQRTVLRDPRMEIYSCGREDIRSGQIDRRVLAALAYLSERGFRPTVTSLKCGHSVYTASGNISHHSSGNAVDIARINGIPILGNQGRGSVTEAAINDMLKLQGTLQPAQIISLMEMGGPTFAMGDHADHIHVGFTPSYGPGEKGARPSSLLDPSQWDKLLDRIGELDQPDVPTEPSRFSLPGKKRGKVKRASRAHIGEEAAGRSSRRASTTLVRAVELLPFAQLDLPGELPLADGRYVVRPPGEPEARPDVLVLRTLGAPRSRRRLARRRSATLAEDPGAAALPLTRATLVKALPFADAGAAADWLAEVSRDDDLSRALVGEVTRTVNRAMLAHRVSAPDPYAADIHPAAAAAVRFGYGSGEEVASGRWSEARELGEGRRRSLRAEIVDGVGAQERIAAVLGGREQVGADEALLLSAERSAAEGRLELAIVTLEAALAASAAEGADVGEAGSALASLRDRSRSGGELDGAAVRAATRAGRRAIRAARVDSTSS